MRPCNMSLLRACRRRDWCWYYWHFSMWVEWVSTYLCKHARFHVRFHVQGRERRKNIFYIYEYFLFHCTVICVTYICMCSCISLASRYLFRKWNIILSRCGRHVHFQLQLSSMCTRTSFFLNMRNLLSFCCSGFFLFNAAYKCVDKADCSAWWIYCCLVINA